MLEAKTGESAGQVTPQPTIVGRYLLHREIARGGMATIHIARLMGDEGFSRIVAAKRLHPEFAEDAEFVAMFLDEARIASRVQHRNVVPVLDVVAAGADVMLVQEYVHGAPLSWLLRSTERHKGLLPINIAVSIACQVLSGLHATHETLDELGQPMFIVHRDVSPQNVMIALDGTARLLDFGVAKAAMAAHVTREGTYKGKLAYSAPEQLRGAATRQSDVYSLSVLLWELLVGQRMHRTKNGADLVYTVLHKTPTTLRDALTEAQLWDGLSAAERRQLIVLDPIVQKGLAIDTNERFQTALEMEEALCEVARPASPSAVAAWLKQTGKEFLEKREGVIAAEEASFRRHSGTAGSSVPPLPIHSSIQLKQPRSGGHEASFALREWLGRRSVKATLLTLLTCVLASIGFVLLAENESAAPLPVRASMLPEGARPAAASEAPSKAPTQSPQSSRSLPREDAPELKTDAAAREPSRREEPTGAVRERAPRRVRVSISRLQTEEPASAPQPELPPPPPPPPPSAANDCSTPYYFQGSKKVFKPACL